MEAISFQDHNLQRCTQCQGIWFEQAQHKLVKREKGAESVDIGKSAVGREYDKMENVPCPDCGILLERRPDALQPHIFYDVCPQGHGIFFDAGEFRDFVKEDIMDFFKGLPWFRGA